MRIKIDNILTIFLLGFVILFPFINGNKENYGQIWVDISVVATWVYAFIIYAVGTFTEEFEKLTKWQRFVVPIVTLFIIPLMTLPFTFGFLKLFIPWAENVYIDYFQLAIEYDLLLLTVISLMFFIVDLILMNKVKKINYHLNFYFSDMPITIIFGILFVYVKFVAVDQGLEFFCQGAIAFQLILSNIIWMHNDNDFWMSIFNKIK